MLRRHLETIIRKKINAGEVIAYEFKWNKKKVKFPEKFITTYNAQAHSIDRSNFRDFVKIENN